MEIPLSGLRRKYGDISSILRRHKMFLFIPSLAIQVFGFTASVEKLFKGTV